MRRLVLVLALAAAAPLAAEEPEKDLLAEARPEYAEAKKDLEELREKKLKEDVKLELWKDADATIFQDEILNREFPAGRAEPLGRLYAALGLVPRGYDIRKELLEIYKRDETPYYYCERDKTVLVGKAEKVFASALFMQLAYGLQDQHFEAPKLHARALEAEDDDALVAARGLSQGEAQYLFIAWTCAKKNLPETKLEQLVFTRGTRSREKIEEDSRANVKKLGGEAGKRLEEELDRLAKLPRYLYRRLIDVPLKGALMVHQAKKAGGWKAVDELWADPPRSTAQLLRPSVKLLGETREDPTAIDLPDSSAALGEGWKKTVRTSIGEMGIESLLDDVLAPGKGAAARGWVGDRCQAYERDGKTAVAWTIAWTKAEFAERFLQAWREVVAKRLPGVEERKVVLFGDERYASTWEGPDGTSGLVRSATTVTIVEGVPAAAIVPVIEQALKATQTPAKKRP